MKFEPKISGIRVTEFNIIPLFDSQFVWLSEVMKKIQNQKAMNFILDTFRFTKGEAEKAHDWCAILDWDSIMKVSILESYPEYEKEMVSYFGEGWLEHYIRFNH
jgi:hypothetical protein